MPSYMRMALIPDPKPEAFGSALDDDRTNFRPTSPAHPIFKIKSNIEAVQL
jgi:hypothetical protein